MDNDRSTIGLGQTVSFRCVVSIWLAVTCFAVRAAGQEPAATAVLARYEDGHYDEGQAALQEVSDFGDLKDSLEDHVRQWISDAVPEAFERRRHIAALVTLEAAHIGFARRQFLDGRRLIDLGSRILRQSSPDEFERIWTLASFALIQSVQNARLSPGMPADTMLAMDGQHWSEARARFPHEPRLLLAAVVSRPEARRLPRRPGTGAAFMTHGIAHDPSARIRNSVDERAAALEPVSARAVQRTIDDLTGLINVPGVAAEARLRRGILLFHRADLVESLTDVKAASESSDAFVAHLGHLYRGLIFQATNRPAAAIEAYRSALGRVPGARSAVLLLATALFLADRHDEAGALMEREFAKPAPSDPWREFSLSDYRFWPTYLAALRRMVDE